MQRYGTTLKTYYRITIKEKLEHSMSDWLGDLEISTLSNGETLLTGVFIDQVALRGLLDNLWNHNLTILSIEREIK